MTQKRKTYTREFKLEAIELTETSDKPITQIAARSMPVPTTSR